MMTYNTISDLVITSFVDFLNDEQLEVTPETRLLDDLDLDSTEMVGVFVNLERKLGISLKGVKFAQLSTVDSLVREVNSRLL